MPDGPQYKNRQGPQRSNWKGPARRTPKCGTYEAQPFLQVGQGYETRQAKTRKGKF